MTSKIFLLVFLDSFPPFKITAFEDFIASDEICEITSGLASKIIPRTPIGHETFVKISPLSSSLSNNFYRLDLLNLQYRAPLESCRAFYYHQVLNG